MSQPFVGVQLGSHSVFDEGVNHVLDVLQETAQINALFVYSHAYQNFIKNRPGEGLADHGRGVNTSERELGHRWVPSNDEYYGSTYLRHSDNSTTEYAGRDVLEELSAPAKARGMKVFARMLEGNEGFLARAIDGWPQILTVDVYGRRGAVPCWNNPDYRSWMTGTVADVFSTHELDGFKYGAERSGPLSQMLLHGKAPGCFCEFCQSDGAARGINVDRAMRGFRAMHEFCEKCAQGNRPVDGAFVTFLRLLLQYPEILAWEQLWHESMDSGAQQMYGTIKAIAPAAQIGWHVWHGVTFDPFYQAEMDYAEMASYSDWIKPVVYHDIAGVRIRNVCEELATTVFSDMTPASVRTFLFEVLGYDSKMEADFDALPTDGMSPEYVWREVRRCVLALNGRVPVYAGVGFDVPTNGNPIRSTPERVFEATYRAFAAGAAGLLVSREYDEMRIENLQAVGRAIDRAAADGLTSVEGNIS